MATLKTRTAGGATEASKASPGLGEAAARAAWRSLAQAGQGRGSERLLRTGRPPSLGRLEDKNKPNPPQEQLSRLPPPAPGRGSVPLFPPAPGAFWWGGSQEEAGEDVLSRPEAEDVKPPLPLGRPSWRKLRRLQGRPRTGPGPEAPSPRPEGPRGEGGGAGKPAGSPPRQLGASGRTRPQGGHCSRVMGASPPISCCWASS